MDKNAKQAKAAKVKAEEAALNRILCWIIGGAVLEFLLLLLDRYYSHYTVAQIELAVALRTAVKIMAVAALVCAAAALFWWNNARKSSKGAQLPGALCLFLLGVSVSCFAAWFFASPGLQLMVIVVPVVIVLALVFYLYQHEFFLIACESALGLLGVYACGRSLGSGYAFVGYGYVAVVAVLTILAALLCRRAQGADGVVESKGRKVHLFPKDANYAFLYTGGVVTIAVLAVALAGVSSVVLYGVLAAWVLVMAVYYTVKLM